MNSFRRGWDFLKQSWQMALKDRDLIKPSIYALIAGIIISLIAFVPMGLAGFLLGDTKFGQPIVYVMGALLISIKSRMLLPLQKAFGYTFEDVDQTIKPMALRGSDPVGSMGMDSPVMAD